MSTLIVLLPPRDPAVPSQEWQLPDMPFLLIDKSGRTMRAGDASLALLPRASSTVLMVAARDLLMMAAAVPALKGPRLRQALPNVVEDQLIQDPQTCHIAIDAQPLADGRRLLAIVDRGWFRFIHESFVGAGHRNLRAVPVTACLPRPLSGVAVDDALAEAMSDAHAEASAAAAAPASEAGSSSASGASAAAGGTEPTADASAPSREPIVAALLGEAIQSSPAVLLGDVPQEAPAPRVELAIARGRIGEGFAVPADAVGATLAALAGDTPLTLYALSGVPGSEPHVMSTSAIDAPMQRAIDSVAHRTTAHPLTFETLAQRALECRFDLCQFEFTSQPWRLDRATLRRMRVPIALVAAAALVAIIGANVQWLVLARQRDAINAQMTEALLNGFPKTTVVLDAPGQMTRQLQQLRVAAGELSPEDFLSLADGLARSLGPLPVNGLAALDYQNHRLDVTFKPQVKVDADFAQRLARNGLNGAIDSNTGKWTIRSGQ
ncbi:type II secretion system protein GspL [Paraburkholderia sp. SARCC-3016]|uniref:type II secretion system protein GspL n=1 Tax=Paraburkholderia sp. SARCC-3016 TaxID=3058611 RepID=UPI00280A2BD4|nr:type II secretion system protein GspL [Paraburkholderia sp. SARCC-3016]MDQ7982337.1 type II secretion system protein GspL [Paraburkholderia sp. SARCC-3016]